MFSALTITEEAMLYLNVKNFGAKGDGTTDDLTAIQAAVDSVDSTYGGTVFFPAGKYRISDTIDITQNGVELRGEGGPGDAWSFGTSNLLVDASGTAIETSTGLLNVNIKQLHIRAANGAGGGDGIVINESNMCLIENCTIKGFSAGNAILIDAGSDPAVALWNRVQNVQTGYCKYGVHLAGDWPNGNWIESCVFYGDESPVAGGVGVWLYGSANYVSNVDVEGFVTGLLLSYGPAQQITNFRSEGCTTGINIATSHHCTVLGATLKDATTGITIGGGSHKAIIIPNQFNNCTTDISDSGLRTIILSDGEGNLQLNSAPVALEDAATIAVDMSLGYNFSVTITDDRAMGNPSNAVAGKGGVFIIKQDGSGGHALTWGNQYYFADGTAPTITTDASAVCVVPYFCESSSIIHCGTGLLDMGTT